MQNDKRHTIKLLGAGVFVSAFGGTLSGCLSGNLGASPSHPPQSLNEPQIIKSRNWLSGKTSLITSNYPSDSIFKQDAACQISLFPRNTEGPCYFSTTTGEDISTGLSGLPMMYCFQIIDQDCNPVSGYEVEIWHCDNRGIYSADTSNSLDSRRFSAGFCSNGDEAAMKSTWYRGVLTTNAMGRVNFKSTFPGWYPGRTAHVHFKVKKGNKTSVTSQLCFTDQLCQEIYNQEEHYKSRGSQDTSIRTDGFFADAETFRFGMKQNADGSLLAFKQIQISA
jgi:protocatechuate 3,4-dioxygenase beta subunit